MTPISFDQIFSQKTMSATTQEPKSQEESSKGSFTFKASGIKPSGILYSSESPQNNRTSDAGKETYSFLKLDTSSSNSFSVKPDSTSVEPVPDNSTEPSPKKEPAESTLNSTTSSEPKSYVFGQNLEARIVKADSTQSSSQSDKPPSQPEILIPSEGAKPMNSLPVQKVFTGEEDERVIVEMSCKLFIFESNNKSWHSKGRNILHLNENFAEPHKSRVICRTHGTQLLFLNSPIWSEMLCELANPNSVKISAQMGEEGIRVVLIQGEKKDTAQLYEALKARIMNCTLYKDRTPTPTPTSTPSKSQENETCGIDIPVPACRVDPQALSTLVPEINVTPHTKRTLSRRNSSEESDDEGEVEVTEKTEAEEENLNKRSKLSDSVDQ